MSNNFQPIVGSPNLPRLTYVADASTTFTKGKLAYRDTSTGELKEATNAAGTVLNIEAIVADTVTTGASDATIEAYPIMPGVLYAAKCANNTAANQLNKAHTITAAGLVSNTSTHSAAVGGVFIAVAISGEAADRTLIGYFVKVGQVTA